LEREAGRIERASELYERASKTEAASALPHFALSELAQERGDSATALSETERALSLSSGAQRARALRVLRRLATSAGELVGAQKWHEQLVRLEGGGYAVDAEWLPELDAHHDLDRALAYSTSLLERHPQAAESGTLRLQRARWLRSLGRPEDALLELEAALKRVGGQRGKRREVLEEQLAAARDAGRLEALAAQWQTSRDVLELSVAARALTELGRLAEARDTLARWVAAAPSDLDARRALADSLETAGALTAALRQRQAIAGLAPTSRPDELKLIDAMIGAGRSVEALNRVQAATRTASPDELPALLERMEALGHPERATALLGTLAQQHPQVPEYWMELGERLWSSGSSQEALAAWAHVAPEDSRDPKAHTELARLLLEHGQREDGVARLRRALELSPDSPDLQLALSRALAPLEEPGSDEGAADEAERLARAVTRNPRATAEQRLEARRHLLGLWRSGRRFAQELAAMQRAVAAGGADLETRRLLVLGLVTERDWDHAEQAARDVLGSAPGSTEGLLQLLEILLAKNEHREAAGLLERLIEVQPTMSAQYARQGVKLAAQLRDGALLERFAVVLRAAAPRDPLPDREQARLQLAQGRPEAALAALRRAMSLGDATGETGLQLARLLLARDRSTEALGVLTPLLKTLRDDVAVETVGAMAIHAALTTGDSEPLQQDLTALAIARPERRVYQRLALRLLTARVTEQRAAASSEETRHDAASPREEALIVRNLALLTSSLRDPRNPQAKLVLSLLSRAGTQAGAALVDFARREGNLALRLEALRAALGSPQARLSDGLRALALDETQPAPLRALALQGLGGGGEDTERLLLEPLLQTPDRDLAGLAAWAAAQRGDKDQLERLRRRVRRPETPFEVRAGLLAAMASRPSLVTVPASEWDDAEPTCRALALLALPAPELPAWRERVARLLLDADPRLRAAARTALERLGGAKPSEASARGAPGLRALIDETLDGPHDERAFQAGLSAIRGELAAVEQQAHGALGPWYAPRGSWPTPGETPTPR